MDLEVVGRHALLFDDDTASVFVNSPEALVPWSVNPSLLIDRYDVRHLLQQLPLAPPKKQQKQQQGRPSQLGLSDGDGVSQFELDRERYLDLPEDDNCNEEGDPSSETNKKAEMAGCGGYQAVPFSYGNPGVSGDLKDSEVGSNICGYHPPFPLPESLLNNLPPTEKAHQIIARTAIFVNEHGGQSEIVLRVKQGDNPTFGFLMPDHHLHAYFRFLVDHPELLKVEVDLNDRQEEKQKSDSGENESRVVGGGALSLLGSIYGSGEDDEGAHQVDSDSKEIEPGNSAAAAVAVYTHRSEQGVSTTHTVEAKTSVKHPGAANENASSSKKNRSVIAASADTMRSKTREADTGSINVSKDKPRPSVSDLILEPPSSLKRMVDKIVEFILRNGKEFEAVLIEQDSMNGRFPFLLPSNQYHSYYLKVLREASEPKPLGKKTPDQNHDTSRHARTRNVHETPLKGPGAHVQSIAGQLEGFYDPERKEKFKMVIGGSKKDTHDPPPKPAKQSGVSADAAAAIVMAATRGLTSPTQLESLPKMSVNDSVRGLIGEGSHASSLGSFSYYNGQTSIAKPVSDVKSDTSMPVNLSGSIQQSDKKGSSTTNDVSVANAIAKTAARATASEADSSEACLTREQKQKAERLKRAKMFASMIKSGQSHKNELLPTVIGHSESHGGSILSGAESDPLGREREGSSVPNAEISDTVEKSKEKDMLQYHCGEHVSRKKHNSRSRDREEDSEEDHKHSRKKHHSEHSSRSTSRDKRKHKGHSSSRSKRHSPSEDEHQHRRRSDSRHRHRHHSSSDDEHWHRSSDRHHMKSHSERKLEVEGKGNAMTSEQEVSLNFSNDLQEAAMPSVLGSQPSNATEVSDELRAKVRAMLLATL